MLKQRFMTSVVALAVLAVVLFVLPASDCPRESSLRWCWQGAYEWGGFIFPHEVQRRFIYVALIGAVFAGVFFSLPNAGLSRRRVQDSAGVVAGRADLDVVSSRQGFRSR